MCSANGRSLRRDVKNAHGPSNSVIGWSDGRVYQTTAKAQLVADATMDRVKPVTPDARFGSKTAANDTRAVLLKKPRSAGSDERPHRALIEIADALCAGRRR